MEVLYSQLRPPGPVKRTSLVTTVILSAVILIFSTPLLAGIFTSSRAATADLTPRDFPCRLEQPFWFNGTSPSKWNSTEQIPGGRGSQAAPGFNFGGVCGYQGFKCVISFVVYGDDPKYVTGALRNLRLAKDVYPGWTPRFYYDEATVPKNISHILGKEEAELIPYSSLNGVTGMMARFLVAEDNTVDRYIIRDTDSRLNLREKAAVEEWIASGYSIHILRDHPAHRRVIMGGMWGGVKGAVGNLSQILHSIQMDYVSYNADQDFLSKFVWPKIKDDQIAHDSNSCEKYPNSFSFPTRRIGYEHVGQVFSDKDAPRNCCSYNFEAPLACRRQPEWKTG